MVEDENKMEESTSTTVILSSDSKKVEEEKDDFAIEIEKLQMTLREMLDCTSSPSTSLDSSNEKPLGLSACRLIRIPCDHFSTASSCHSDSGNSSSREASTALPFTVYGGAASGRLLLIDIVRRHELIGILNPNDILLSIDNVKVCGMVRSEVTRIMEEAMRDNDQIAIEILPAGNMTDDICEILADKKHVALQAVIRDNLYSKTVPYTTRPPREGEVDGEHYKFVSTDEFNRLLDEGDLLEHGTYQGHLYGTPRPLEGYEEGDMMGITDGLLPPNWETAYTENGDKYFIDHNNGTTTWEDPRELPPGWEQVDDPTYGTFFVDHINKKTQYDRPNYGLITAGSSATLDNRRYGTLPSANHASHHNTYQYFNSNTLKSSPRDSGFDSSPTRYRKFGEPPEAAGSAASGAGSASSYEKTYGCHLPGGNPLFTTDPAKLGGELISTKIIKGPKGLGFTLIGNDASSKGDEFIQVKSVLNGGPAAANGVLRSGDILVRVNGRLLLGASQKEACDVFVSIPVGDAVDIQVCRGYELFIDPTNRIVTENVYSASYRNRDLHEIDIFKGTEGFGFTIADSAKGQCVKKILYPSQCANLMEGDVIVELDGRNVRPIPHTQLVDMLRERPIGYRGKLVVKRGNANMSPKSRSRTPTASMGRYGESGTSVERGTVSNSNNVVGGRSKTPAGRLNSRGEEMTSMETNGRSTLQRQPAVSSDNWDGSGTMNRIRPSSTTLGFATPNYIPISTFTQRPSDLITVSLIRKPVGFGFRLLGGIESKTPLTVGQIVAGGAAEEDGRLQEGDEIAEIDGHLVEGASHSEAVALLEAAAHNKHVKMVVRRPRNDVRRGSLNSGDKAGQYDVLLHRPETDGFGFVLMSSHHKNGSIIGQIQLGSPASRCGRLSVGDRVIAVNGIDILNLSHSDIILLIKNSGLSVRLTIAPPENGSSIPLASSTLGRNFSTNGNGNGNGNHYDSNNYGYPASTSVGVIPYEAVPSQHAHSRQTSNYLPFENLSINDRLPINGNLMNVELERGPRGFGFSIRGGQEFGAMPLFVLRIADDGPAKGDGRLQVGDQLISINGSDTRGMSHDDAIRLIKQKPTVELTVLRNKLP